MKSKPLLTLLGSVILLVGSTTLSAGVTQPLDWKTCWQLAVQSNRDLQNARLELAVSDTNYIISRYDYLPSFSLSSSVSKAIGSSTESSSIGAAVSQPLYPGLLSRPDVKQSWEFLLELGLSSR